MKKINFDTLPKEKQDNIVELLRMINLHKELVDIVEDGNQLKAMEKVTGRLYTLLFD